MPPESPPDPAWLLRNLTHGDWRRRAGACEALARFPDQARYAAPVLFELLQDPERAVQDAAYRALHQLGPLEAHDLDLFEGRLEDLAPDARHRAARLLAVSGPADGSIWDQSEDRTAPGVFPVHRR